MDVESHFEQLFILVADWKPSFVSTGFVTFECCWDAAVNAKRM